MSVCFVEEGKLYWDRNQWMPFNCIVIIMITIIGIILEAISFQVSVKKRRKESSLFGVRKS